MSDELIFKLASGDITVWRDSSGAIMLKVREPFGDPLELAEHEALELAEVLVRLAKETG
jgi:hypothetical protein